MSKYTKEFLNILVRWLCFTFIFAVVYCLISFATYFSDELMDIDSKRFGYYLLGLFTFEFIERIMR